MIDSLNQELKSSVRDAITAGRKASHLEESGRKWTGSWNSSAADYERSFRYVFDEKFSIYLQKRKIGREKVVALDLMSSPAMLCELPIDGGVAVGLGKLANDRYSTVMNEKKISYINGNLLQHAPWKEISDWCDKSKVKGFDLITCRVDLHGTHNDYLPANSKVYYSLVDRAWRLLDADGGVFLVDVPQSFYKNGISRNLMTLWLDTLTENKIDFVFKENSAIKFTRNPDSPKHLPILQPYK